LPNKTNKTRNPYARRKRVGQSRAVEAVRFGIDIQRPGYNLFVLGEPGTGRHCMVRRLLEAEAAHGTIGAVNEKIEGFFDICKARGLTGGQGVLIPASNVKHLMLREDVVSACAQSQFGIYPVEDVDQAIELLTGVPAGQANDEGLVPEGTINYRVAAQLAELSALRQAFATAVRQGSDNSKGAAHRRSDPVTQLLARDVG
jgi:hypothetical protein